MFSIRGLTIDAATGKPATTNVIARLKGDSQNGFGLAWQTSSREDGTFELHNVLPGEYLLIASTNAAEPATGREEVSVSDSDITGVKLTLAKGATLTGTVKLEGDGPPVRPMIILADSEGAAFGNSSDAKAEADGAFELRNIAPAKYYAFAQELPEGVYVKSIRFAQQDVTRTKLDLTAGVSGTLDILLSPRAAQVSGTVKNKDGAAMTGVEVTLWPKQGLPENVWRAPNRSSTDQNGDFRIAGLAPGDYYIVAWEEMETNLTFDLDFIKRFASPETAITLEEGAHQTVQPKLISREDAAAEAAKLP